MPFISYEVLKRSDIEETNILKEQRQMNLTHMHSLHIQTKMRTHFVRLTKIYSNEHESNTHRHVFCFVFLLNEIFPL